MARNPTDYTEEFFGIDVIPTGETDPVHATRLVGGSRISITHNPVTKAATIAASDTASLSVVPPLGYDPIEMWDVDEGLQLTAGGALVSWRGLNGTIACPISQTMVVETDSLGGTREMLAFNGSTDGLRAWIGALRRTSAALAFHVQLVAANNTAAYQSICQLSVDGGLGRLELLHPATVNYLQAGGSQDPNNLTYTTGWVSGLEVVLSAVRVANSRLELFVNGTSVGSQGDTTTGAQLNASDFIVGHTANATNANFFYGSIRRIAVYNVAHTATEAAIVDAAWRGF
jgi:hypothetical protein